MRGQRCYIKFDKIWPFLDFSGRELSGLFGELGQLEGAGYIKNGIEVEPGSGGNGIQPFGVDGHFLTGDGIFGHSESLSRLQEIGGRGHRRFSFLMNLWRG